MDLRVKKTKSAIINAFLQLRAKKPLERITVKELSDLAEINKATFYLHYTDIYDLSKTLENELLDDVFSGLCHPDTVFSEPKLFIRELTDGLVSNQSLIDIIFSNDRRGIFVDRLETKIRAFLFENYPQLKNNPQTDFLLSYIIKGGYYAFVDNTKYNTSDRCEMISEMAECLTNNFFNKPNEN
ncbi:MAG: TetR/AcrR family transcriptional regulator [Ruminococcaceae bacterium]|nr:TetR/AcrR family transcriptional regulator [Oscillospiraceae bacterium]